MARIPEQPFTESKQLPAESVPPVELCTMIGNEPAIALYLTCGWSRTDRVGHNDQGGVVYDEHVVTKCLD
jgi:hypothetical protein